MNKIFGLLSLMIINSLSAQFKVEVEAPETFTGKEVYLYSLIGSKDILESLVGLHGRIKQSEASWNHFTPIHVDLFCINDITNDYISGSFYGLMMDERIPSDTIIVSNGKFKVPIIH
mgnify:CR=1 FL=1